MSHEIRVVGRGLMLTAAALAAMSGPAWGAALNFTGSSSHDWNTSANWTDAADPGRHAVPTETDDARIGPGTAAVLATGVDGRVRSLDLDRTASLTVTGRSLAVAGGAASVMRGALALSDAALRLDGTTEWSAGTWSASRSTIDSAGTLSVSGDVSATGSGASLL